MSECLIKKTRKSRVMGNNGPRRHQMKEYGVVSDDVPPEVIEEIMNIAQNYKENDLGGDNYQISQHCDVKNSFTSSDQYKQILLQTLVGENEVDETKYTQWRDDLGVKHIKSYLESKFKGPYRARISVMPPGNDLNWHIDTDTSVLCRVQIPAVSKGSKFQWKTKTGETEVEMETGKSYFVNTGWVHRVVNESDITRVVLIFGVDYDNLPNKNDLTLV